MISKCECQHEGQDKINGFGMRVFNAGKVLSRCTVCGKTKDLGGPKKESKTKQQKTDEPKKAKK